MFTNIPVIVILGTNASGKSSLGIQLAKKYNGEIISADSRQIIKGFDLCCGKVSVDEQKIVPHHMIDIYNIQDKFSVSDYQKQVYELIPQIYQRGKIPFIVGGTGLYIDAIVKGFIFGNEEIDYELRRELDGKSVSELQSMLSATSLEFLDEKRSDFNNKRRLIRIIEKEHKGISVFPENNNPEFDFLQIGVTWPKDVLFERIDKRLAKRVDNGMIDEISDFLKNGGNDQLLFNLGLEYKYIAWYVEGKYTSIDEFKFEMSRAIKRFAKKQIKWFKRNSSIHWIDMMQDYFTESCNLIDSFLNEN